MPSFISVSVSVSALTLLSILATSCRHDSPDEIDAGPSSVDETCASICSRATECGVDSGSTGGDCNSACHDQPDARRACVAACDQLTCSDWLGCVSACGQDGSAGDPYGSDEACGDAAAGINCPGDVITCNINVSPDTGDTHSVCMPFCTNAACPAPASGTAVPVCSTTESPATCRLDCSGNKTCPDGMECLAEAEFTCMWKVHNM